MKKQQTKKQPKLELLNHLYQTLSEQADLKSTFRVISNIIQEHLQSSYLDFVLLDKKEKDKATIYSIPNHGEIKELYTDIVGISKQTIHSKKITIEEDIQNSLYYNQWRRTTQSEVCFPIFHKKEVIGCINLEFRKRQQFDKDTITTLEIISKAVGNTVYTNHLLEELKESENKFRTIVENMNEGLWLGDKKHNTVYVNPQFQEMTGLSYKECLDKHCLDFYDEESAKKIEIQHALTGPEKTKQHKLTFINNKTKKPIPVLCSGTPLPTGTIGIFTDLSKLKAQEAQISQLSKSEKLFAHVTENSIDGIVSIDKNLRINTWNKGATKMFGYSQEEILGKNTRILIPEDKLKQGELEQIIKLCLEKGFIRNFETSRVKKGGKEFPMALSVTKLIDNRDRFTGFGIIYRDITYQKKAEQDLQARFESMQNAYLELGKQRRQLDYLLETLNIAIGDEDFPNIENYLVNAAIMLTKSDGATLRLYNEKDEMLHLKALSGVQASWWGKSKIPFKGSIAEKAYQTKRPLFINDLQNNPIYSSPKLASEHGFIASMCLPLYVKNKYLGNISLYTSSKHKLNLVDDSFISNFSKQASLALITNSKKLA